MSGRHAESFADRLPPIVPRQEETIDHLTDEMADLLYPGRRPRPFRMALEFPAFAGPNYERAVALARQAELYRETGAGDERVHHAACGTAGASLLRELYDIVGPVPGTEVLVDGRRVPGARELWLPLYWIFVGVEDR
jgi:hypothetical protein